MYVGGDVPVGMSRESSESVCDAVRAMQALSTTYDNTNKPLNHGFVSSALSVTAASIAPTASSDSDTGCIQYAPPHSTPSLSSPPVIDALADRSWFPNHMGK